MASTVNVHILGPVVFNGTGSFTLYGVENRDIDPGAKEYVAFAAGEVSPSYVATMNSEQKINLTVRDIAVALANISPLTGLALDTTGPSALTSVDIFSTKMLNLALQAGSSAHYKTRITDCLVLPKNLSWSMHNPAKMVFELWPISTDGSTNPMTQTDSVSLPSNLVVAQEYTGGPVVHNSTEIPGVQGVNIDFGLSAEYRFTNSDPFPVRVHINQVAPKATIDTKDLLSITNFGTQGLQAAGTMEFYFTKMASGGVRTAAGTSEHVKFSTASGMPKIFPRSFSASDRNDSQGQIEVIFRKNASNPVYTLSTASTRP